MVKLSLIVSVAVFHVTTLDFTLPSWEFDLAHSVSLFVNSLCNELIVHKTLRTVGKVDGQRLPGAATCAQSPDLSESYSVPSWPEDTGQPPRLSVWHLTWRRLACVLKPNCEQSAVLQGTLWLAGAGGATWHKQDSSLRCLYFRISSYVGRIFKYRNID